MKREHEKRNRKECKKIPRISHAGEVLHLRFIPRKTLIIKRMLKREMIRTTVLDRTTGRVCVCVCVCVPREFNFHFCPEQESSNVFLRLFTLYISNLLLITQRSVYCE